MRSSLRTIPVTLILALGLSGCESREGRRGLSNRCDAVPLSAIGDHPGWAFAVGPCGEVARWRESGDRAIEVFDARHGLLATFPDPNGYGGLVSFSPDGERLAFSSLRSDLGFGDVRLVNLSTPREAEVLAFRGGAAWRFAPGGRLVVYESDEAPAGEGTWLRPEGIQAFGPLALLALPGEPAGGPSSSWERRTMLSNADVPAAPLALFAPEGDGGPVELQLFDEETWAVRSLGPIQADWRELGATRARESVMVGRDGRRALVVSGCERPADCETTAVRVLELEGGPGSPFSDDVDGWSSPVIGPRSLVVGAMGPMAEAAGLHMLDAEGRVHDLDGHSLVAVLDDEVLTARDGAVFAWSGTRAASGSTAPSSEPELARVADTAAAVTVSPSGEAAAVLVSPGGPVIVWRERLGAVIAPAAVEVEALWDDGVVLARTDANRLALFSLADGGLGSWATTCDDKAVRRGTSLFFRTCSADADRLWRVDLRTGRDSELLAGEPGGAGLTGGRGIRFAVSPDGSHLAATLVPLGRRTETLFAGALP